MLKKQNLTPPLVGILGGGQLARMLAEAAQKLKVQTLIYTPHADCPAKEFATQLIIGAITDKKTLHNFLQKVDICIFESEFVSTSLLEEAAKNTRVKFYPSLKTMATLQDKLKQKLLLTKHKLPTAPFTAYSKKESLPEWINFLQSHFPTGCVIKWSQLGYDGKGVFFLDAAHKSNDATSFCKKALEKNIPLFAEKMIRFKRELAIIGVQSRKKIFKTYPTIISKQENGICDVVHGPATNFNLSAQQEKKTIHIAKTIAKAANIVGSFGIEFFEDDKGDIFVNEIAPRVHNSGHYTQNACETSQFENHLRAVLNYPLKTTKTTPGFVMKNIIGPKEIHLKRSPSTVPSTPRTMALHWYEKADIIPGRKMGHINATTNNPKNVLTLIRKTNSVIEQWAQKLKKISPKEH